MDEERIAADTNELLRMMQEDELQDKVATQTKSAINDYARSRGISPQSVHYYIRTGRIEKERCVCGRGVIDITRADLVLGFKKRETEDDNEPD